MASKGDPLNKGAEARSKMRPQSEFVRVEPSEKERQTIKALDFSAENMSDALEELTQAEYKVTFKWDTYADCQCCWLIAPDSNEDNKGLILSGRGSTAVKAFKQVFWLHTVKLHAIWPAPTGNTKVELDD
jgi:hypothetical protein